MRPYGCSESPMEILMGAEIPPMGRLIGVLEGHEKRFR